MSESGFYDTRDDLVGGTDNPWTADAEWDGVQAREGSPEVDVRRGGAGQASFSGTLSQSKLAS